MNHRSFGQLQSDEVAGDGVEGDPKSLNMSSGMIVAKAHLNLKLPQTFRELCELCSAIDFGVGRPSGQVVLVRKVRPVVYAIIGGRSVTRKPMRVGDFSK